MANWKKPHGRNKKITRKLMEKTEPDEFKPQRKRRKPHKEHRDWACNGIHVSDHAVIRYLQIIYGFDIAAVRKEMVPPDVAATIKRMGIGKLPIGEGSKLVIQNGVVVTVIGPKGIYEKE